jgi:predicted RNA binding protein YcfA (HicA-like mRNA interferase family)
VKLPRNLNGVDLADHLIRHWGYRRTRQTGSHIQIRTDHPSGQSITIPAHWPLKTGTLSGILKDIAEHNQVSREDILRGL